MTDNALVPDLDRPAVRLVRRLPDSPSIVWGALTDREQLRSWFPCDVDVQGGGWEVGRAITFVFPSHVIDMTLTGQVLEVDEPRLLSFTWGDEVLRFELAPEGGGTRLTLINELPARAAARNAAGWEECLDRMCGLEVASDAWQKRFDSYSEAFEPTLGPQEGPPPGYQGG